MKKKSNHVIEVSSESFDQSLEDLNSEKNVTN